MTYAQRRLTFRSASEQRVGEWRYHEADRIDVTLESGTGVKSSPYRGEYTQLIL